MPGRSYTAGDECGYRFGFNGKETDNESGLQDYGMRIYNPGLVKFLSVDPMTKKYPMLTPYQFASNTPIQAIDLDGAEANYVKLDKKLAGLTVIHLTIDLQLHDKTGMTPEQLANFISESETDISTTFGGAFPEEGVIVFVTTNITVTTTPLNEDKDFGFTIENEPITEQDKKTGRITTLGQANGLNDARHSNMQVLKDKVYKEATDTRTMEKRVVSEVSTRSRRRTILHELGHGLGLSHHKQIPFEGFIGSFLNSFRGGKLNLMKQIRFVPAVASFKEATTLLSKQIKQILKTIDKSSKKNDTSAKKDL